MTASELLAAGMIPLDTMDDFIKANFKPTQTEPEPLPMATEKPKRTQKKLKFKCIDLGDPNTEMARCISINGGRLWLDREETAWIPKEKTWET